MGTIDIEKVKKGLRYCQVDENDDLEECAKCSYNEISLIVQECRTQMDRDALEVIEALEEQIKTMTEKLNELIKQQREKAETIDTLYEILNDVCKDVREETEGDYVCGLCEYDGAHKTDSGDWAGECPGFESSDCFCMKNEIRKMCGKEMI